MSAEENKTISRRAVENINRGDLDAYLQLYDESVVLHGYPPQIPPNFEGATMFYGALLGGLPDAQVIIEDLLAEGDEVAVRFTLRGTHQGELMGVPATGKQLAMAGTAILRFANGKCVERWQNADDLGLMQQLGAIPAPEAAGA